MRLATGLHASIWDVSLWTLDKLHCRLLDPFPRLDLSSTILSTCIRSTVLALALGVSNRKTKDVPGYMHWSDLPKNRQLACVLASVWGTDFWTLDRLQCGPFEPLPELDPNSTYIVHIDRLKWRPLDPALPKPRQQGIGTVVWLFVQTKQNFDI